MNSEPEIDALDAAWAGFEAAVHALGERIRTDPLNADADARFAAYKTAATLIAESYVSQLHFDRLRPEALPSFGPLFNFAAPAPDFRYHLVQLEAGAAYRVRGRRGDAALIDVQQLSSWFGQSRAITLANELFDDQNLALDAEACFDFVLSPEPTTGAWWKLDPRAQTVFIREYFTDYATQGRASEFYFERLAADQGCTVLPRAEAVQRLGAFAQSVRDYSPFLSMPQTFADVGDNQFKEIRFGDLGMDDQRYFHARYQLADDEVLLLTWCVPASYRYWSFALYDDAWQMLNVRHRQANLNQALAQVGADRQLVAVLSDADPGIANWLDVDGHRSGIVMLRTKGVSECALPSLQRVKRAQLAQQLPRDTARISTEARRAALAARLHHFQRREQR